MVLPLDDAHDGDIEAAGGEAARRMLQAAARAAGVFAPHAPVDCGGLGLGMVDRAPVFEEAGYSLFGPMALNIAAPDEGNVHLLDQVATAAQRERYLQPLARGEVRSAFAMTEPAPGAGADPTMLTTTASKVDGGWLVNGRKWFITGADGAAFFIIMARTSGEPGSPGGATMFLMPADHRRGRGRPPRRDRRQVDARGPLRGGLHATRSCPTTTCSGESTRDSATPRSGSARPG